MSTDDMRTPPPSGAEAEVLLREARANVMRRIARDRERVHRFRWGAAVLAAAVGFGGGGLAAGAALASTAPLQDGTMRGSQTTVVPRPDFSASHLSVSLTCLTPGGFTVSLADEAVTDHFTFRCQDDAATVTYEFPLHHSDDPHPLEITTDDDAAYIVSASYSARNREVAATNAAGETIGTLTDETLPDLVLVLGRDPDGHPLEGYARTEDLFGPTPVPREVVLEWSQEQRGGRSIPLYASDGHTVIGSYGVAG
ncbi:hypothetical protein [Microbacterium album]|uniref:Uncharacterized protein n=1 Tax=Microbacterium album TaxID=2053191 RepID=A0A917IHN0_9MICO|nr:hypothetical protein [Microbacterium album]GGH47548.1 hypothetical protein GCM10010921_24380 [Microbacterium album]